MKYFAQIEAFFNRTMSVSERQAFEHELADNAALTQEQDAYQTAMDLFDFTARNLSDDQIMDAGQKQEGAKGDLRKLISQHSTALIFLTLVIALVLFIFLGRTLQTQEESRPLPPEKEQPVKRDVPVADAAPRESVDPDPAPIYAQLEPAASIPENPVAKSPSELQKTETPSITKAGSSIAMTEQEPEVKPVTNGSLSTRESKLTAINSINSGEQVVFQAEEQINLKPGFHAKAGSFFKAESGTDKLTFNTSIANGENVVFQAGQQITLSPGFHAEAGSSFKAVVKPD